MTLSEYMAERHLTHAKMALKIGVSREYVTMILLGDRIPSLAVAAKIEKVTKGVVAAKSLVAAA